MRKKCRIWWPKEASSEPLPSSSFFLFGWFISCSPASIDVVVASSRDELWLSCHQYPLQEMLCDANGKMPVSLQERSLFSLLGESVPRVSGNWEILKVGEEEGGCSGSVSRYGVASEAKSENVGEEDCEGWSCGCCPPGESGNWIRLVCDPHEHAGRGIRWLPKLHHLHWNGRVDILCDVHVILYETPLYGVHHYSLSFGNASDNMNATSKEPKWVKELNGKDLLFDMDTVILAINSAAAARMVLERCVRSGKWFLALGWQLLAIFVASVSTLFYMVLQLLRRFFSFGSRNWLQKSSTRIFQATSANIHIRCCQILYWPFLLHDYSIRSKSCVEYAEKAALHRHSMWSSLAADLLMGNLIGLALLLHAESTWLWISKFANDVTNELLRSGCVWLMGVPAGFKLNMELARVLGMISLNAIQIWSTLWIFLGCFFVYFIKGLAILGILFGATIPAALAIDTITLASMHVSSLHCGFSFLYSRQTQAIASLWRLFRGRKWNPLRQRLDSYDYNVKQHIVGSLLFTPLLLLLPTSSVFYIFFTILNTAVILFNVLIEIAISMIHSTPYVKIFFWLVRRRRFPSGIWFQIVSCKSGCLDQDCSSSNLSTQRCSQPNRSTMLVSICQSNFLSVGELVWPHYNTIFCGFSGFLTASAYRALTGKITVSTFGSCLPAKLPWICIPAREYWCFCYHSILASMAERECLA